MNGPEMLVSMFKTWHKISESSSCGDLHFPFDIRHIFCIMVNLYMNYSGP